MPAARRCTIILHIGNGRMLIVFDVLFRLLRHVYGADHVSYVRNITDVDDKINARAAERGVDIRVLTDEMTAIFHEDAKALGCLPPTVEPRATDNIVEMIALIEKLIAKGHAYVAEWPCAVRCALDARLWQALETPARRNDRRRASRSRAL